MGCTVSWIEVDKLGLSPGDDAMQWLAAHPGATRGDLEALPRVNAQAAAANAAAGDTTASAWPDPLPLVAKVQSLPYPVDALPEGIQEAVQEVRQFTKAPVALVASSALSALSVVIQAHVDVQRTEKLQGPVGLFLLTIADSGERKSTCDSFFTAAIRDYEAKQAETARPAQAKYRADADAWKAKHDALTDRIRAEAKNVNREPKLKK